MQNFNFCSPTYFEFGRNTESKAAELVKRFGGSKVLLHYGGGSIKKSGLYDRVTASLKEGGVDFVELGGVVPNPEKR
jgi:alcohol dehydrogenase YqhD (iron-dependent ADH family)